MKKALSLLLAIGMAASFSLGAYAEELDLVISASGEGLSTEESATEVAEDVQDAAGSYTLAEEWTPVVSDAEIAELTEAISAAEAKYSESETTVAAAELDESTYDAYASYTNDVYGFVDRMYSIVLGRTADTPGRADWTSGLLAGRYTGADIIFGFFDSTEYKNRSRTNEQMVTDAYNAILGRAPETAGYTYWLESLNLGMSTIGIANGFCASTEFSNICRTYGVNPGSFPVARMEARDLNRGVTAFVSRLYTQCLGRAYDTAGLNDWCQRILNNTVTGAAAAGGFVFSDEYKNKHVSNTDYITMLYATFFDRTPDLNGAVSWLEKLNYTTSREAVMNGFINSVEFKQLCAEAGINLGGNFATPDDTESWKMNVKLLTLINSERIASGLSVDKSLKLRNDMFDVATARVKELPVRSAELVKAGKEVGSTDEYRPNNQGDFQAIYASLNFPTNYKYEVRASARTSYTPEQIVAAWMKNDTTKAALLNTGSTMFGAAFLYQSERGWYAVELAG